MRVMELHSPVKVVQRGSGRTATAAAAYRSASRIVCERTGLVHDYTRKQGVEHTAMLLPDEAPEWAHDRTRLWNEAELREKHPRAQPAREIEVALPAEFTEKQRREAGLAIGTWIVHRYGAAADLAWHKPGREGDQRNHHIHILFTTRRFENGEWAKSKDRDLDDLKKGPIEITAMRRAVADTLNNIATRDQLPVYVEHLSFEKRDLQQEPTKHLGPDVSEMERRGVQTDRGEENRQIEQRNAERRRLEEEQKIIAIDVARDKLRRQKAEKAVADRIAQNIVDGQARPDPTETFYRESQDRRRALLDSLRLRYGQQEKEAQAEIAKRYQAIDNAGLFMRFWRSVTGRTQEDRQEIARQAQLLDELHVRRQREQDAFEASRRDQLQRLIQQRRKEAQEREELIRAEMAVMEKAEALQALQRREKAQDLARETARLENVAKLQREALKPQQEFQQATAPEIKPEVKHAQTPAVEQKDTRTPMEIEIEELQREMEERDNNRDDKRGMSR